MITKTELTLLLNKFIRIKIRFDKVRRVYFINNLPIDEINPLYFAQITREIESKLLYVLKISNDRKKFLAEILEILWAKVDWYKNTKIYEPNFIKEFAMAVKETHGDHNHSEEEYDALEIFSTSQEIPNDKELSKLLNVLELHNEYLDMLCSYVTKLEMEVETINFDELITLDIKKTIFNTGPRCNVNMDKITTANLFYLLMKAGFLTIDPKDSTNDINLMFEFIENNFTYGTSNERNPIIKMRKEFTYITSHGHKVRQHIIIDKLIQTLEQLRPKQT